MFEKVAISEEPIFPNRLAREREQDPLRCRHWLDVANAPNLHGWGFVVYDVTIQDDSDKQVLDQTTTSNPLEASKPAEVAVTRLQGWIDRLLDDKSISGSFCERLKANLEWTIIQLPGASKQDVRDAFKTGNRTVELVHSNDSNPNYPSDFERYDRVCLMLDDDSVISILKHDTNLNIDVSAFYNHDSFITIVDPQFDQPVLVASRARGTPRGQPKPSFPIPGGLYYLGYKKSKTRELVPLFWALANDSWNHEETLQMMDDKMNSDFSCTATTERILEKGYP